jgi:hypothetical protein
MNQLRLTFQVDVIEAAVYLLDLPVFGMSDAIRWISTDLRERRGLRLKTKSILEQQSDERSKIYFGNTLVSFTLVLQNCSYGQFLQSKWYSQRASELLHLTLESCSAVRYETWAVRAEKSEARALLPVDKL